VRSAAALLVAGVGCTGPGDLSIQADFPPAVAFIAVVGIDDSGAMTGATGLASVSDGYAKLFGDFPGVAGFEVHGYALASLQSLGVPLEEATLRIPLRAAETDEARLPAPIWGQKFDADGGAFGGTIPVRALTADWLPLCPQRVTEGQRVALGCAFGDCATTVTQSGCRVTIDASACALGALDAEISPAGALIVEASPVLGQCEETPSSPGVSVALACSGGTAETCRIEVQTSSVPPPLVIEKLALTSSVAPYIERDGNGVLVSRRPPSGYLAAMAIVGETVMVARNLGPPWRPQDCPPGRGGVIDLIARDTLIVDTATAVPRCVIGLIRDPMGRGALFLTGGPAPRVGIIGADGQVKADRALDDVPHPADEYVIGIQASARGIFVLFTVPVFDPGSTATLAVLDPLLLTTLAFEPISNQRAEILGVDLDAKVLLVANSRDVLYTPTADAKLGPGRPLWELCSHGNGIKPSTIFPHALSGQLVLPALDSNSPAGYVIDVQDRCRTVVYPWGAVEGYGAAAWTDGRVLFGLMTSAPPYEASVAIVDPIGARFASGALRIGSGPPHAMDVDAQGRVWLILPWEGQVARITPQ